MKGIASARAIDIKVLKDLEETVVRERLIPNGARAGALALQRGGARVPQSMARDRPSPYGERG